MRLTTALSPAAAVGDETVVPPYDVAAGDETVVPPPAAAAGDGARAGGGLGLGLGLGLGAGESDAGAGAGRGSSSASRTAASGAAGGEPADWSTAVQPSSLFHLAAFFVSQATKMNPT